MEKKYLAHRGRHKLGPYATREEAIEAFKLKYPRVRLILSGYGSDGARFDIQWTQLDE